MHIFGTFTLTNNKPCGSGGTVLTADSELQDFISESGFAWGQLRQWPAPAADRS